MDWLKYYTRNNIESIESIDSLYKIIEEVLELDRPLLNSPHQREPSLKEEFMKGERKLVLTLEAIPEIAVSELGWTDVSGKGEAEIQGPERKRLSQFLENIEGNDFVAKVNSLGKFYEDPDTAMASMFPAGEAQNTAEQIRVALSYMVFFKTLTKVISNFNAASAGFNFEAFLAVLAGGFQVPANKGTIADFVSRSEGHDMPISLKLYGEGHLHVGGSFTDLVNDLVSPQYDVPIMRYLACTKKFEDDKKAGLDINGTIKFMRFDFTLANVMNILSISSKRSRDNILLAKPFIERYEAGEQDLDYRASLPGINLPSVEELESEYIEFLKARLSNYRYLEEEEIENLINLVQWGHNDSLFLPVQVVEYDEQGEKLVFSQVSRGVSPIPSSASSKGDSKKIFQGILAMVANSMPEKLTPDAAASQSTVSAFSKDVKKIANEIAKANSDILSKYNVSELNKQRASMLEGAFDGVTHERSLEIYNELVNDPEKQKIALQNSFGYLNRKQFNLVQTAVEGLRGLVDPKTPVVPEGQEEVVFGRIEVGARNTQNMLNRMTSVLNEAIFDIFLSVKAIQDNTYAYVAGGMREDDKAENAINASTEVISKTTELRTTNK